MAILDLEEQFMFFNAVPGDGDGYGYGYGYGDEFGLEVRTQKPSHLNE